MDKEKTPKQKRTPQEVGRSARRIGKGFERDIANDIVKAVGAPFTKKDCYRTPGSGGHVYIQGCDEQISPRLQQIVPLGIEAKKRDKFQIRQLLREGMTKLLSSFHEQAVAACRGDYKDLKPTLVIKGPEEETLACMRLDDLLSWAKGKIYPTITYSIHYQYEGQPWVAVPWENFLQIVKQKGEDYRAKINLAVAS